MTNICYVSIWLNEKDQIQNREKPEFKPRQIQRYVVKREERRIENRQCRKNICIIFALQPAAPNVSHTCIQNPCKKKILLRTCDVFICVLENEMLHLEGLSWTN